MSLTAGGQKLLCSLVVWYRIHLYCQMAAEQLGYSVTAATASASNVFIWSVCVCHNGKIFGVGTNTKSILSHLPCMIWSQNFTSV